MHGKNTSFSPIIRFLMTLISLFYLITVVHCPSHASFFTLLSTVILQWLFFISMLLIFRLYWVYLFSTSLQVVFFPITSIFYVLIVFHYITFDTYLVLLLQLFFLTALDTWTIFPTLSLYWFPYSRPPPSNLQRNL